jgi:hypothetical protein
MMEEKKSFISNKPAHWEMSSERLGSSGPVHWEESFVASFVQQRKQSTQ